MENTPRKTISFQIPTADELASENRRPLAPVSFALAIILFFFSFMDLRCTNGRKIASVTGFQLVAGKEFNTSGLLNGGFDSNLFGTETTDADESQRMPPNPWAILALLSAVGGLVVFIRRFTWENLVGAAAAGMGITYLSILRWSYMLNAGEYARAQMYIVFKPAYWLTILAFAVAGTISLFRLRLWEAAASPPPMPDDHSSSLV